MILRRFCQVVLLVATVLTAAAWCVSGPMARNWGAARAPQEALAPDEAVAALWLIRCTAPAVGLAALVALRRSRRLEPVLRHAAVGLSRATTVHTAASTATTSADKPLRVATWLFRGSLAAWLLLAITRWGGAVGDRLSEWPVYRLNPGSVVLPNMSESNRDVIRYVQSETPDDARILVVSDQAVFFLSYYLLPRRIYHKVHPDAERVIPQPDQQRQLAAYRLRDIPPDELRSLHPDFVLEYFEGPAYVDRQHLYDDPRWISSVRQLHEDPAYIPAYNVALRPFGEVTPAP